MAHKKNSKNVLDDYLERLSQMFQDPSSLGRDCLCEELLALVVKCREQRNGYFPGQHHSLGHSLEKDDAELLKILEGEKSE